MPIRFSCQCGKQLSAPDEFAGRQTRCSSCQAEVVIPRAATDIMPIAAVPPLAPAPDQAFGSPPPAEAGVPGATSKLALFSLFCGGAGFCLPVFLSVPAIILGFMGLSAVGKSGGKLKGKGLAIAGLVLGFVTIPLIVFHMGVAVGMLMTAVGKSRDAANRINSVNNLKQIGLAMHVYSDANNFTMPSEASSQRRHPVSWRVEILPFIEEMALYQQYNFDEPWDGPTNKQLLSRMPKIYLDPRFQRPEDRASGLTYYRAFVGPQSILGSAKAPTLGEITTADGTSTTLLVVEAGEPVPWTKPDDPSFNETGPFGGPRRIDFLALYADGHVAPMPIKTPSSTIRALITWNGKEQVTPP